mmetsp:Transcript_23665/g.42843  ORF Transcript_23665/g.42843 Transcript_23665/m.42843 type:complete len:298 (+) Transcript_23665:78-971(+)
MPSMDPSRAERPPCLQQRRRRTSWQLVLLLAGTVSAMPALQTPRLAGRGIALLEVPQDKVAPSGAVADLLSLAEAGLRPLREKVVSGQIVPKFGEQAQAVLADVVERAGAGAEIERAVDAKLQALFLRQLALLRQQIASKIRKASSRSPQAVSQADEQFVAQAEELRRPGSSWSYEQDRYALRATIEGSFRRDAVLAEERQLAAQSQQSTVEVISRLQGQMENLQQRVQHMRSGSPWFLSSSYRIPGTPIQLIGRYQQGRGSVELNLSPDRDPVTAQAGFVKGVGPANVGMNANFGF